MKTLINPSNIKQKNKKTIAFDKNVEIIEECKIDLPNYADHF